MIVSAIDSYYSYVCQQMVLAQAKVLINGSLVPQPMCGVANARDWPQTLPIEGGLYLLFISAREAGIFSQAQKGYEYFCQWMWLLIGTDIQPAVMAQNRSDRYRQNIQIMQNLRTSNYPGYCVKQDYSVNSQGIVTATPSTSAFVASNLEMVTWGDLAFMPKSDNAKSGLVFGAAKVELYAYDDINILVA